MGLFSFKKQKEELKSEKASGKMIQPLTSEPLFIYNRYSNQSFSQKYNSDVLLALYETVSPINTVINYIASKGAEIPVVHYRYLANGKKKPIGETEAIKFVDSMSIRDAIIQFLIHGNLFIQKKQTPGFSLPTNGIIHPSNRIYIIPQRSLDQYGNPDNTVDVFENPLKKYSKQLDSGVMKDFKKDEFIHVKDIQANLRGKDFYYGSSRLYAAIDTSYTLKYLAETINTILSAKGALGFISRNSKQNELEPLMWKEPIENVEKSINDNYGTTNGKRAIMATFADLRWNKMDSPISDFIPVELSSFEFEQICNQMGGVPAMLFNAKTNASYNNMREAKATFYTSCLSPILTHIYAEISKDLKLNFVNEWIEPDFSEIEELQKDRLQNASALKVESEYLTTMLDKKLITKNDFLDNMGFQKNSDPSFNEIKESQPTESVNTNQNGTEQI
jgi:hypothetical protein